VSTDGRTGSAGCGVWVQVERGDRRSDSATARFTGSTNDGRVMTHSHARTYVARTQRWHRQLDSQRAVVPPPPNLETSSGTPKKQWLDHNGIGNSLPPADLWTCAGRRGHCGVTQQSCSYQAITTTTTTTTTLQATIADISSPG